MCVCDRQVDVVPGETSLHQTSVPVYETGALASYRHSWRCCHIQWYTQFQRQFPFERLKNKLTNRETLLPVTVSPSKRYPGTGNWHRAAYDKNVGLSHSYLKEQQRLCYCYCFVHHFWCKHCAHLVLAKNCEHYYYNVPKNQTFEIVLFGYKTEFSGTTSAAVSSSYFTFYTYIQHDRLEINHGVKLHSFTPYVKIWWYWENRFCFSNLFWTPFPMSLRPSQV